MIHSGGEWCHPVPVAQWIARRTSNPKVVGSSPTGDEILFQSRERILKGELSVVGYHSFFAQCLVLGEATYPDPYPYVCYNLEGNFSFQEG